MYRMAHRTVQRAAAGRAPEPAGCLRQVLAQAGRIPQVQEEGQVEGLGDLLRELFHCQERSDQARQADRAARHPVVTALAGGRGAFPGDRVEGFGRPLSHLDSGRGDDRRTGAIEDSSVRNMVRNPRLARAISDASWSEFRTMLEYKADWYGRTVIAIDRFYPSSRTCAECGGIADRLPLHVREWTCHCGAVHDRDVNAARNIRAAGLAVLACGDGVRPPRG